MNEFDKCLLKLAILNEFKNSEVKVQGPEVKVQNSNPNLTEGWMEEIYGRKYRVKRFGDQIWMMENLKVPPGQLPFPIPLKNTRKNGETGECYYAWNDAMAIAKECRGWHLPSNEEFNKLSSILGSKVESEFDIKLTGHVYDGSFCDLGKNGRFWTSSEYSSSHACGRYLSTDILNSYNYNKDYGFSVRLVKDS